LLHCGAKFEFLTAQHYRTDIQLKNKTESLIYSNCQLRRNVVNYTSMH